MTFGRVSHDLVSPEFVSVWVFVERPFAGVTFVSFELVAVRG